MIHYHVWFSLKAAVSEAEGFAAVRAFSEELASRGTLERCDLLKNSSQPPKTKLLPYHALFVFHDDEQMNAAFSRKREEGIHAGPHGTLMASVAEFHVEVFRAV
jgi:hypothetical protein